MQMICCEECGYKYMIKDEVLDKDGYNAEIYYCSELCYRNHLNIELGYLVQQSIEYIATRPNFTN